MYVSLKFGAKLRDLDLGPNHDGPRADEELSLTTKRMKDMKRFL
jgi:hypothetical protein